MQQNRFTQVAGLLLILGLTLGLVTTLMTSPVSAASFEDIPQPAVSDGEGFTVEATKAPLESPRLIVELRSAPVVVALESDIKAAGTRGALDVNAPSVASYISALEAEQAAFMSELQATIPSASMATYINENGLHEIASYQLLFNGMAVDLGTAIQRWDKSTLQQQIAKMPGVKAVYEDRAYSTLLYTSTGVINAPMAWDSAAIGGIENAGEGIKVASMDGGVHKDAPMFSGEGYEYPEGFGPNGLGDTANNNGKIIVSRAYFRSWDPPSPGDENPWPGERGTSHGVHTASIAAGNVIEDAAIYDTTLSEINGPELGRISGVAPRAYVMSYRLFYASVNDNAQFYTAEGLAALEDIARDQPDVLNNSWGGGAYSEGGEFDPLDSAVINAANSGIFVAFATGNDGPNPATADHPSPHYINVAATSSGGTIIRGHLDITAPEPAPDAYQDMGIGGARFGGVISANVRIEYNVITAESIDPTNIEGCDEWEGTPFDGAAALIRRGACNFSDKVYNAQLAGAVAAIIYNDEARGDTLITMSCGGDKCAPGIITIPSVFIWYSHGVGISEWYNEHGAEAKVAVDTLAPIQFGNDVDLVVNFSSRGPGVGNVLKPDIAAPGFNILAQGYTEANEEVEGEARHLGYGQQSGTSMAAPHVAGAAALLRQAYPDWSNAAIKSALMSSAKYMDIYNVDGSPAQPLDMGAGRLDIAAAMDPGVILNPPSLSFGPVSEGEQETIEVMITSVADTTETYNISTLYTGDSFTDTTALPGFSAEPSSLTLAPGESATIEVAFDSTASNGLGDNQGYILMTSENHNAHMPAWARVMYDDPLADVLIIDNDFSDEVGNFDYLWYYTSALDELDYSYNVVSTLEGAGTAATIPDATTLAAYKAIIHFTGDNFQPNGTFGISTGLTDLDKNRLVEYLNNGGSVIAMGQDMAQALDTNETDMEPSDAYYTDHLSANYIQDSVSGDVTPNSYIMATDDAPAFISDVRIDLSQPRKFSGGTLLSGANEVPSVESNVTGFFGFNYDVDQQLLQYAVSLVVSPTTVVEITNAHIHSGTVGNNGGDVHAIFPFTTPQVFSDSLDYFGTVEGVTLADMGILGPGTQGATRYVNIHSTANPSGEVRGQLEVDPLDNQIYVDEVDVESHDGSQVPENVPFGEYSNFSGTPLFFYPGPYNVYHGYVAIANRDQPSLENPGISYQGRSIYASFGLEGMSNNFNPRTGITPTTRTELLDAFLDWVWSEEQSVIISSTISENSNGLVMLEAAVSENNGVAYRWDFGDRSPTVGPNPSNAAGHVYRRCGTYTVRAEVTDALGNVSIGSTEVGYRHAS